MNGWIVRRDRLLTGLMITHQQWTREFTRRAKVRGDIKGKTQRNGRKNDTGMAREILEGDARERERVHEER